MTKMIKSWSYSRYNTFKQCKRHAKLKFIDRIPEGDRPLPPGKTEHANDRGNRIHKACEDFLTGERFDLIPELDFFKEDLDSLRALFADGDTVSVEEEWGFDKDFMPRSYRGAWLLMKADVMVRPTEFAATVIDLKTGKKSGNEIKHMEQVMLYASGAIARDPKLEVVTVELWYCDQNETTSVDVTRDEALRTQAIWHARGNEITDATVFPPNPTLWTCQYCPYSPAGTGDCPAGYVNKAKRQQFNAKRFGR